MTQLKINKFKKTIQGVTYKREALNKAGKKMFDTIASMYMERKIRNVDTFYKMIDTIKSRKAEVKRKISKFNKTIIPKITPAVVAPVINQQKNFHIQAIIKTAVQYRQKNGTDHVFNEVFRESQIIKAHTQAEAEAEYRLELYDIYQAYAGEDSYKSQKIVGDIIFSSSLPVDSVVEAKNKIESVRMKFVRGEQVGYEFFKEDTQFLNKSSKLNFCVIDNFTGMFPGSEKMAMTKDKFVGMCEEYYSTVDDVEFDKCVQSDLDAGLFETRAIEIPANLETIDWTASVWDTNENKWNQKRNIKNYVEPPTYKYITVPKVAEGSGWGEDKGVSPNCLFWICKKLDISHYAYDITNKCFLKYVSKSYNHRGLYYYAINEHMYLINDKYTKKSMCARAKDEASVRTNIIETVEKKNIFADLPIVENCDISSAKDLTESSILMFTRVLDSGTVNEEGETIFTTRNEINKEMEDVIRLYNIIPAKINSTNYKVSSFEFSLGDNKFYCFLDANKVSDIYTSHANHKNVKQLCTENKIEFKNQSLISYNKQKFTQIIEQKNKRVVFTPEEREALWVRDEETCCDCNEPIALDGFEIDHILPLSAFGTNNDNNLQCLCKSCHKLKTQFEKESGFHQNIDSFTYSAFNTQVQDIVNSNLYQSRAFIEKLVIDTPSKNDTVFHIDDNKCRTNIMRYGEDNYARFSVMDRVEVYDASKHNGTGIYFIESKNYLPMHGNGWYFKPMVDFCLAQSIITQDQIKLTVQSAFEIPFHYFNDFIDFCYETYDEKLAKFSVNSMIGSFNLNPAKNLHTITVGIAKNNLSSHIDLLKNMDHFVNTFEINNETFFHMFKNSESTSMESENPIYNQIVQMEQIEMYKKKMLVEKYSGTVLDLNTDCVSCTFPENKFPFVMMADGINLKKHHWDSAKQVKKYKLETKDRLRYEKGKQSKRTKTFVNVAEQWKETTDVADNNFEPLVTQILANKSQLIMGPGGCGKSTLIKQIQAVLTKDNKEYVTLCPTNKSCLIVPGAMTLNKFKNKMSDKKYMKNTVLDYIFVDEVSMMHEYFYKFLLVVKKFKPNASFIITGDFKQLAPVKDIYERNDYATSPALYELCAGNKLTLSKCRRTDDAEFFEMCQRPMSKVPVAEFGKEQTDINLVFTNKKRMAINKHLMDKQIEAHEETNKEIERINIQKKKSKDKGKVGLFLEKRPYDPNSQDVTLFVGMPVISRKTATKNDDGFLEASTLEPFHSVITEGDIFTTVNNDNKSSVLFGNEKNGALIKSMLYKDTVHFGVGERFKVTDVKNNEKITLTSLDTEGKIVKNGKVVFEKPELEKEEHLVANNEMFTIIEINKNSIMLRSQADENKIVKNNVKSFQMNFYVAYAMTIHKSQGSTFNQPYTIHQWNRLDEKLKYVAISRTTKKEFINIIV